MVINLIFRIFLGVIAVLTVVFLVSKYLDLRLPDFNKNMLKNKELQTLDIYSEEDMAKAIYGCYALSNFGEYEGTINCYIAKVHRDIDFKLVDKELENLGLRKEVYIKIPLSKGDVIVITYKNKKIYIKII